VLATTKQVSEAPGREHGDQDKWSWVDASIWTTRMLAALGNGVQGGKWFSLMDKVWRQSTLRAAWERVANNNGASGVDGQSAQGFGLKADQYLEELSVALRAGQYRPQAVRRVMIPKGAGKLRGLGIPTIKDRIVQGAVKRVIEPIFEAEFHPSSYGFRPGRGCHTALREVERLLRAGHCYVVDADIREYFDRISHRRLMEKIESRISDSGVLDLIRGWLTQNIVQELQEWTPTQGTQQGAVLSPLLANIYLHDMDHEMARRGYHVVRYADDFVILCTSAAQAAAALADVQAWMAAHDLELHPDKTKVGDCRIPGQGFEFLGYRFEAGRRFIRRKSLQSFKDRVRKWTKPSIGRSITAVIAKLKPTQRGWFRYFKHAYYRIFTALDGFIRRRLRALLRYQSKRPGRGRTHADHQRWNNAYFAELGLFTFTEAHANASRSRCRNH
jgi:RNA-directed DNA polymerase